MYLFSPIITAIGISRGYKKNEYTVTDQEINNPEAFPDICILIIQYTKCYIGKRRVTNTFKERKRQSFSKE